MLLLLVLVLLVYAVVGICDEVFTTCDTLVDIIDATLVDIIDATLVVGEMTDEESVEEEGLMILVEETAGGVSKWSKIVTLLLQESVTQHM